MQVSPSPLVLLRYFFTEVCVKAHETGRADPVISLNGGLGEMELPGTPESAFPNFPVQGHGPYAVKLEIQLSDPKPDDPARYTGSLSILGMFAVHRGGIPGESPAEIEKLVMVNGNSMLFGMVREMLHNLTLRGPAEPVILSTVSFNPPPDQEVPAPESVAESQAQYAGTTKQKAAKK